MEVMTYVYDLNGTLIDTTAKSIRTNLPPEGYKQMFQHGLQFHEEISVPLKGDYYLRIGLHDRNSKPRRSNRGSQSLRSRISLFRCLHPYPP